MQDFDPSEMKSVSIPEGGNKFVSPISKKNFRTEKKFWSPEKY